MSVASEIISSSGYTGNSALGGFLNNAVDIDISPLAELTKYAVLYNQAEYKQRQADTDAQIKELAKLSTIDLNSLYESDKEQFIPELAKLKDAAAKWARERPKTSQEKIQHQLDYQNLFTDINGKYTILKKRQLNYLKEVGDINSGSLTGEQINFKMKDLKERMGGKDIYKPLGKEVKFNFKVVESADPIKLISAVNNGTGDYSTMVEVTSLDHVNTNRQNAAKLFEIKANFIPETIKDPATGKEIANPKFPTDPTLAREQRTKNLMKGEAAEILDRGKIMSEIIKGGGYVVNGVFDEERFLRENTDPAILNPYFLIKADSENAKKEIVEINQKRYVSKGINGVLTNMKISPELLAKAKGFDNGGITELQLLNADSFNKLKQAQELKVVSKETGLAQGYSAQAITKRANEQDFTIAKGTLRVAQEKLLIEIGEKGLVPNGKGGYKTTGTTPGGAATTDYAEKMKNDFVKKIGSGAVKVSELTLEQQEYLKTKNVTIGEDVTIKKVDGGFEIEETVTTTDGKGKETKETKTSSLSEDGLKQGINKVIGAASKEYREAGGEPATPGAPRKWHFDATGKIIYE